MKRKKEARARASFSLEFSPCLVSMSADSRETSPENRLVHAEGLHNIALHIHDIDRSWIQPG